MANFESPDVRDILNLEHCVIKNIDADALEKCESCDKILQCLDAFAEKWKRESHVTPLTLSAYDVPDPVKDGGAQQRLIPEFAELQALWKDLEKTGKNARAIMHLPHEGIAHQIGQLAKLGSTKIKKIVVVTPSPEQPKLLDVIAETLAHFGQKGEPTVAALRKALIDHNAVLFIAHVHLLHAKSAGPDADALRQLFNGLTTGDTPFGKHALFGLCVARGVNLTAEYLEKLNMPVLSFAPSIQDKAAATGLLWKLVDDCVEARARLEGADQTSELYFGLEDPRLKRARIGVSRVISDGGTIPVSSLFLRAAALSDRTMMSDHDPTAGFNRLVSEPFLQSSSRLQAIRADVLSTIKSLDEKSLMILRLVSSGVYWLSNTMFDEVKKHLRQWRTLTWQDITDFAFKHPTLIANVGVEKMRSPLAVKAVVQQHWRENDDPLRSITHRGIAFYLRRAANQILKNHKPDEVQLDREYPFVIPKEGPAIVYQAEALRHFVRAAENCETPQKDRGAALRIFEKLDTINTSKGQKSHALSRNIGRYHLTLELLHLLSIDGRGHDPFESDDQKFQETYHHDLGLCRLSMLQLPEVQEASRIGLMSPYPDEKVQAALRLNAIAAATNRLEFDNARTLINESREVFQQMEPATRKPYESRLSVHEANLMAADGNIPKALEIFSSLLDHGKVRPMKGDRVFAFVDSLIMNPAVDIDALQFALTLIESNMSSEERAGFTHEMLRFDIKRAQVYAKMGLCHAAEAVLDNVCLTLNKHGASTRALYDFMLASGETLIGLGEPIWAYAGYLHNCYRRADRIGAKLTRRAAARLALRALDEMQAQLDRHTSKRERKEMIKQSLSRRKKAPASDDSPKLIQCRHAFSHSRSKNLWKEIRSDDLKEARDPYHSFDMYLTQFDRAGWIDDLMSVDFINSMRAELQQRS